MAEAGLEKRVIEPEIAALLADLKHRLERRFGDRFVALYLFGSRARGDHDPDSDVDVAVILDQKLPRSFAVHEEIIEITYDLMLESDFYIQPWPLERGSLDDPNAHPDPRISLAARFSARGSASIEGPPRASKSGRALSAGAACVGRYRWCHQPRLLCDVLCSPCRSSASRH